MPDTNDEERTEEVSTSSDPWAEAFAAVEREDNAGSSDDTGSTESTEEQSESSDSKPEPESTEPSDAESAGGAEPVASEDTGGTVPSEPAADSDSVWGEIPLGEDTTVEPEFSGYTEQSAKEFLSDLDRRQRQQASDDVFNALKNNNVHVGPNGKLGYTLDDPAIFQRDDNGMPVFVNPDTGRPFTGDDPRSQAMAWINSFNNELKGIVNSEVTKRQQQLYNDSLPTRRLVEFDPIYNKLDPIRQSMFDAMIEDYEVYNDAGDVIGYSCDLNKTLQAVNRQVRSIRSYGKRESSKTEEEKPVTQPATDMKTTGTPKGKEQVPNFNSVADALGYLQEQELNERKRKK